MRLCQAALQETDIEAVIPEEYNTHTHTHTLGTWSRDSMPSASANFMAISRVVITAETGCPFPMGLPTVTMSGHTPGTGKRR